VSGTKNGAWLGVAISTVFLLIGISAMEAGADADDWFKKGMDGNPIP